jgi:hypothetical protein
MGKEERGIRAPTQGCEQVNASAMARFCRRRAKTMPAFAGEGAFETMPRWLLKNPGAPVSWSFPRKRKPSKRLNSQWNTNPSLRRDDTIGEHFYFCRRSQSAG